VCRRVGYPGEMDMGRGPEPEVSAAKGLPMAGLLTAIQRRGGPFRAFQEGAERN
jgi:hypothetical protein